MADSQTLDVKVPHHLGRAEAKRRLLAGFGKAESMAASGVGGMGAGAVAINVTEAPGDRLDLHAAAMGQTITGHADVFDDHVQITVKLPWLLAKLATAIRPQLEAKAKEALKKLPGPSSPPAKR